MKQVSISRSEPSGAARRAARSASREQIPLRDLSECLLAAYEGVTQRAFRLYQLRGAEPGGELKDWKKAEHDLLGAMPVDLAESQTNVYALAGVPGYAGAEISVAVEDRWLLISGYGHGPEQTERIAGSGAALDGRSFKGTRPDAGTAVKIEEPRVGPGGGQGDCEGGGGGRESFQECVVRRPFCVVELSHKVDATRSVAVLADGLLAIRMPKAILGEKSQGGRAKA